MPLVLAITLACAGLGAFGLLAAIDSGAFNTVLAQIASRRLARTVTFDKLQTHLLSATPSVLIVGLRVGNPAWAGRFDLLEADRVGLAFRWPELLTGRLTPSEIDIDRPRLNLLRLTKTRNNWSPEGQGDGSGPSLSAVRRLRIADGRFVFDDRVRDLRLNGTVAYDAAAGVAFPLMVLAGGVLKGGEVRVSAHGGRLEHRDGKTPYPFAADLQDGATFVSVNGTTAQPLQLSGFDLAASARGPNLADMKYLIGVGLPNSAPYRLTARLARNGPTTRATDLKALIGRSDFTGSIVSDGSKPRRLISVDLDSRVLHAADVGAFLGHIPPHQITRSVSGVAPANHGGQNRLLKDAPIDLKRFRLRDYKLKISAQRFMINGVSPGRLTMEGTLDRGKFALKPFRIAFPSGRADGVLGLDVNGPQPVFSLDGRVQGPLASLIPSLSKSVNGQADLRVHAVGGGGSWKAIAMNAQGRLALWIRDGDIQKAKADFLSGAVIQGAFTALANKGARTGMPCAVAEFGIGHGHVRGERILFVTDVGTAVADGGIDLADETIDLTFYGRPNGLRLFAVKAPVSVIGPMLHPQAKLRLGGGSHGPAPEPPKIKGDRALFCQQLSQAGGG